jgi:hypothetical protein
MVDAPCRATSIMKATRAHAAAIAYVRCLIREGSWFVTSTAIATQHADTQTHVYIPRTSLHKDDACMRVDVISKKPSLLHGGGALPWSDCKLVIFMHCSKRCT